MRKTRAGRKSAPAGIRAEGNPPAVETPSRSPKGNPSSTFKKTEMTEKGKWEDPERPAPD